MAGANLCEPAGVGPMPVLPGFDLAADATPAPLPAVHETRFCATGKGGSVYPCAADVPGPCPAGTMPAEGGTCIPVGVPWTCPPGFIVDPKASGGVDLPPCVPDPGLCGTDPFGGAEDSPLDAFVDPAAPAGGNGKKSSHFHSLHVAISTVPAGSTVHLAAGSYPGSSKISKPLMLKGRCAAMVVLHADAFPVGAAMAVGLPKGSELILRNVTLTGKSLGALTLDSPNALLRLQRVYVHKVYSVGVGAIGADHRVVVEESVIADTDVDSKGYGTGAAAGDGARVDLIDVRVSNSTSIGMVANDPGSTLVVDRVVVDRTQVSPVTGGFGRGVDIDSESKLSARSLRAYANHSAGMRVASGAEASVTGVVIDGTLSDSKGNQGRGVQLDFGGRLTAVGMRLSGNRSCGLCATGAGTQVVARGLIIDNTEASAALSGSGAGVWAAEGAVLDLTDARLFSNRLAGIGVLSPGSLVRLERVLVQSTRSIVEGEFGFGLFAGEESRIDGRWVRLTANRTAGVVVDSSGARINLAHTVIDHTLGRSSDGRGGFGLVAINGGKGTLRHGMVRDNRTAGALAHGAGSTWTLSATQVRDTASGPDTAGYGLLAADGGRVALRGGRSVGNHVAGLACMAQSTFQGATWAGSAGSVLEGTQVDAKTGAWGMGAVATGSACALDLANSLIRNNRTAGVSTGSAPTWVRNSVVVGTLPATYLHAVRRGEPAKPIELADGVVARNAPLTVVGSVVAGHPRAAVLATDAAQAQVQQSLLTGCYYGLVAQAGADLQTAGCLIIGNDTNRAGESGFFVPAPPPLAPLPGAGK